MCQSEMHIWCLLRDYERNWLDLERMSLLRLGEHAHFRELHWLDPARMSRLRPGEHTHFPLASSRSHRPLA